jgi:hypothetical protein
MARDKALVERGREALAQRDQGRERSRLRGLPRRVRPRIPSQYPRLAGQNADLTMGWLKAYASGARPHPVMGPIAAKLSENDTRALAEYISGLR